MNKKIFFLACLITGLSLAILWRWKQQQPRIRDHGFTAIQIGQQRLQVEIVNTPASIAQGLSDREQLGSDGMLFLLPQTNIPQFWMKEMKFDLDIIWFNHNQVVDLTRHLSHPDPHTPLNQLPLYAPQTPVNMALEVEAGQVDTWQIKVGDKLSFP